MKIQLPLTLYGILGLLILLLTPGCTSVKTEKNAEKAVENTIAAAAVRGKITLDGKLSENAWKQVKGEFLKHLPRRGLAAKEAKMLAKDALQSGYVKLLYDKDHLYLGSEFTDGDVGHYCFTDQARLYRYGDMIEFFIYSEDAGCYWELYAAASGAKTSYFYRSRGVVGLEHIYSGNKADLMKGLEVKSYINGTLNKQYDRDKGWSLEMRIPLKELTARSGKKFVPGSRWKVLVARYNYGSDLYMPQVSCFPVLPGSGFHLPQYYAAVDIKSPEQQ